MNSSKKRDQRAWLRWAMSGACGPSVFRMNEWPADAVAGLMVADKPGSLRWLAECARSWAKKDPKTARPGDSWPVYAADSVVEIMAACRRQAFAHGAKIGGVCPVCGGSGSEPAPSWEWRQRSCSPCWASGRTGGPEYERLRAFFMPHGRDWPWERR